MPGNMLEDLVNGLRASRGVAHKGDIAAVVSALGIAGAESAVPVGDDCAAIPQGDGWLLLAIVPSSALALVLGSRRHHHPEVLRLGAGAVAFLAVAAFGDWYGMSERWQTVLTVIGGLLLGSAHLLNLRLHRRGHAHHHPVALDRGAAADSAAP